MLKEEDIVDIISDILLMQKDKKEEPKSKYYTGFFLKEKFIKSWTSLPKGRPLLTEYELKQLIKRGEKEIKINKNTIISPLAQEIIQEKGIKIIRE
ncbi:MAG: hypothetical protein ACK4JE_00720 [Endomicrobiia bacterium]